jgi:hypothetical protein
MMRKTTKGLCVAVFALGISFQSVSAAEECASGVSSALDQQRERYIQAQADLATQNYSKRPGSFASTTCLDKLMTSGGLDIFFKPPSLDNIINMVKNLACEQASQIFESLVGGSGLNSSKLQPGEIFNGINLGGNLLQSISQGSSSETGGVTSLINSLFGKGTSTSVTGNSDITNSLKSVFK